MPTQTYHGSCHCRRATFTVDLDLQEGTNKCNCTRCWKSRWWSAQVAPAAFRASGTDTLTNGEHGGFCRECGVNPYGWVPPAEWGGGFWSINVAALDDLDPAVLAEAPVRFQNGREDDWWHVPAETRHL